MSNVLLQKAIELAQSGRREEAIPLFVHIAKADPANVEAWSWLVELLTADQSRDALLFFLTVYPTEPATRSFLETLSARNISPAEIEQLSGELVIDRENIETNGAATETTGSEIDPLLPGDAQSEEESSAVKLSADEGSENTESTEPDESNRWEPEWQAEPPAEMDREVEPGDELEQDAETMELFNLHPATVEIAGDDRVNGVHPNPRRRRGCLPALLILLALVVLIGAGLVVLNRMGIVQLPSSVANLVGMVSPTPTFTPTEAPTFTPEPSPTPSPSSTPEPSLTPTATQAPTASLTPSPTPFPGQVIASDVDGMPLVYIPQGTFIMGWNFGDPGERTEHRVTLSAFLIDQLEVSNQQYAACVDAGACSEPQQTRSYDRNNYYSNPIFANYPVVYVNWQQAGEYCAWAGRRLPTEAEWEYAARGSDQRIYPWGNSTPLRSQANFNFYYDDTTEVGSFPTGASPFGVLDMAGNVAEWVSDWYLESYYSFSPAVNPPGPVDGMVRSFRGGSFANQGDNIRSTRRGHDEEKYVASSLGFRCASDLP